MTKIKSGETLSLDKSKQKKVVKQTKKLKEKVLSGKISLKRTRKPKSNEEQNRGLVYLGHIPHGFYENEIKKYFTQFGKVTNVKLCRSNKTGNSKGFGYVEFSNSDVAKIAAESMNNYLMFKKRIVAEFVTPERRPRNIFKCRSSTKDRYSSKVRTQKQILANKKIDEKKHLINSKARISNLNKKLKKLNKAGIDYTLDSIQLPDNLKPKEKIQSNEESAFEFQQDPYDSDIEVKIPVTEKTHMNRKTLKKSDKGTPKIFKSKTSPKSNLKKPKIEVSPKKVTPKPLKNSKTTTSTVTPKSAKKLKPLTKVSPKQSTPTTKKIPIKNPKQVSKQTPKQK